MNFFAQLLPYSVSQALGWTVVHSIWQAMLIGLITAAVLVMARRKSAAWRYRAAGTGLSLVLLTAGVTFCYYFLDAPPTERGQPALTDGVLTDGAPPEYVVNPTLPTDTTSIEMQIGAYFEQHLPLISAIWLFGFALFLMRLLLQVGQVYYLKNRMNFPTDEYWTELKDALCQKAGIARTIGLVESAMVRTPVVIGHLKPLILFPVGLINRLDPTEVSAILAHEIAHVMRQDYLFNLLQSVVETIFYYHPAVWWLSAAMRREREMATDALAISLTGSSVHYAKALVLIQELAYFPLSPALAFAGRRKSQLFTRVQHILKTQHSTSLAMEKFISASIFCVLILGLAYAQSGPNALSGYDGAANTASQSPTWTAADSTGGIWEGELKNEKLCLMLTRRRSNQGHWTTHECYALDAFSALPRGDGSFTMTREAGTITFEGSFDGKEGFGRFSFQENPAFRKMLADKGIRNIEDHMLIHFCLHNVTGSYIEFLQQKGFQKIDGDDLIGLAVHGLEQQTVNTYLDLFAKQGKKNVRLEDLMSFKIHDITAPYIDSLNSLGFKSLTLDDIMAARIHGIDADFVQQYKSMGHPNLVFDDVMAAKIHGITPEYTANLKKAGFGNLSNDEMMAFKIHEITPEYAASLKNGGFGNLSNDDLVAFKIHEVTPEYAASLKKAGFDNMSNDQILAFKIHEITPEYVASLKASGITGLDNDEIIPYKIHEITPEYIAAFRKMGFTDADNSDLMAFKIHDIDAAFVESYQGVFPGKKLDAGELLNLKIHKVTPAWIRRAREKGFNNMDVDEYIQLKIQFGNKMTEQR